MLLVRSATESHIGRRLTNVKPANDLIRVRPRPDIPSDSDAVKRTQTLVRIIAAHGVQ
jgi:hypothetical protein